MSNLSTAAKKLGRAGGEATKQKLGSEHYRKLAQATNKKRWGDKAKKEAVGVCPHGIWLKIGDCKYGCKPGKFIKK